MRWSVNWVEKATTTGIRNDKIAIGMAVLEPGNSQPAMALPCPRLYLITDGEAITDVGSGITRLGHLDGLHLPAGEMVTLRNNGLRPLQIMSIDMLSIAER